MVVLQGRIEDARTRAYAGDVKAAGALMCLLPDNDRGYEVADAYALCPPERERNRLLPKTGHRSPARSRDGHHRSLPRTIIMRPS